MITEIILGITVLILIPSLYFCFKFAFAILRVQEVLEESLDVLDEKYSSMTEILNRPLFYDSKEVRGVLSDIEKSRDAVHRIALALTNNLEGKEKNEG